MSRLPSLALLAVLAAALAQVPAATGDTSTPAVEELVALALQRSPSLAALREKLAAAQEMVAPAGALPDPMVELMLRNASFPDWAVGSMEMSMVGPESHGHGPARAPGGVGIVLDGSGTARIVELTVTPLAAP